MVIKVLVGEYSPVVCVMEHGRKPVIPGRQTQEIPLERNEWRAEKREFMTAYLMLNVE